MPGYALRCILNFALYGNIQRFEMMKITVLKLWTQWKTPFALSAWNRTEAPAFLPLESPRGILGENACFLYVGKICNHLHDHSKAGSSATS